MPLNYRLKNSYGGNFYVISPKLKQNHPRPRELGGAYRKEPTFHRSGLSELWIERALTGPGRARKNLLMFCTSIWGQGQWREKKVKIQAGNRTKHFTHPSVFFLVQMENVKDSQGGACGNAGSFL